MSMMSLPGAVLAAPAFVLCLQTLAAAADAPAFPGEQSDWYGYARFEFELDGRQCYVVAPKEAAPGRPWIWRARFFGHRPEVDIALLEKGFHVAYMDVANLFGCPKAVAHWNAFYAYLTGTHGFAPKPALEGMSRGGLIVYNWAAANPDKVACIYADAPVCDIKSWPAGKGAGHGAPECWDLCLKAYGLTEEQALAYDRNPMDNLAPLAKAKVPLLHVHGTADESVPLEENTRIVEERYRAMKGSITVILKEGVGHVHGLDDPAPIISFVLEHTGGARAGS
ncbi:MAG: prolyl oligopeptidase family serine peptidase [Candidatus Hydrogenedentes bacterium]|nr:prolyl oligopeptidase family serine peptidase [Candidatus Hydrogenedentota bacterium]